MTSFKSRPYPPPNKKTQAGPDLEAIGDAFRVLLNEADRLKMASIDMRGYIHAEHIEDRIQQVRAMIRGRLTEERTRKQLGLFE